MDKTIKAYHGGAQFEAFDIGGAREGGLFFTQDKWLARQFERKGGATYEVELTMANPKTVDANSFGYWDEGEYGDEVFVHDEDKKKAAIALAKSEGFDSLIAEDVPEGGEDFEPSDQFVVFSVAQVKILQVFRSGMKQNPTFASMGV